MYDLTILGAGPAGLSASIYCARYKMNFITIGELWGGTITEAHLIENYPGTEGVTGVELGQQFVNHAKKLGTEIKQDKIQKITEREKYFVLHTAKQSYMTKNILIATGAERRKLKIPGEERLAGKGVGYCATCDGYFFKGKTVVIVGGGDSAVTAAIYLNDISKKVYLVHRRDELRAEPGWMEKLKEAKDVEFIYNANVTEIKGENKVEKITLDNGKEIETDGVFIEIGSTPSKILTEDLKLETNNRGYIDVDNEQKTNKKGVWAAGDIANKDFKLKQVVTAAAEGAIAANSIYHKIKKES